jgi:thiol-disulfide isomerase/thioredoxin
MTPWPVLALAPVLVLRAGPVAIGPDADKADVSSIVGRRPPAWDDAVTWLDGRARSLASLRGQVVLVRWFMSAECPYCRATAPSLVALDGDYRARGLVVVGMYHHKGKAPLVVDEVRALAGDRYGFRFPVAIDREWRTLRRWWLDDHPRGWTSVSFLLDRRGVVRFVHLGGEYPRGSSDERQLRRWIESLLAEGP